MMSSNKNGVYGQIQEFDLCKIWQMPNSLFVFPNSSNNLIVWVQGSPNNRSISSSYTQINVICFQLTKAFVTTCGVFPPDTGGWQQSGPRCSTQADPSHGTACRVILEGTNRLGGPQTRLTTSQYVLNAPNHSTTPSKPADRGVPCQCRAND